MNVFDRAGICCLAVALMGWTGGLILGNPWMSLAGAVLMVSGAGVLLLGVPLHNAWYAWRVRRWERSPAGMAFRAELEDAAAEWNAAHEAAEQQAAQ